jgi:hypothetical protein
MINRILEKLARWYYLSYIKPLIDAELKTMASQNTAPRNRWVGE